MNVEYVKRALCFHGQPMQKIWENERGPGDLQMLGVPVQTNYEIYQARQRYFTFQDRAKRLKLHQFFAKKATDLYDKDMQKYANVADETHLEKVRSFHAILPPYELLAHKPNDIQSRRWHAILEGINTGDVMYGIVKKTATQNGGPLTIKPLCTAEPIIRYLNHLPIKALILAHDIGPLPLGANGSARGYQVNDFVCCEVLRVLVDVDRIFLAMTGDPKNPKIKYGLIKQEDLPAYYNKANDNATQTYEECLEQSREALNPNYDVLFSINGLDVNDNFTLMRSLKRPFPEEEFAKNLRKSQAEKWAFRAVADGIERFKRGLHMEAFQCLNKALSIDPSNVEGLVARGALFANRGSFQKAVDDFKTALEHNQYHGNARKYLGETLVALGRSLEDEKRYEEAGKAYMDCLEILPHHPQALECMEKLNQHTSVNNGAGLLDNELLEHLINLTAPSTSAANGGSSSDGSSSGSDDSNSDTETANAKTFKKEPSLSPLSKRMALHAASLQAAAAPKPLATTDIQYDKPFYYNLAQPTMGTSGVHDFKLEDDDTATRVRKLLAEASQHKKAKKKKSKKNKKSKKTNEKNKLEMTDLGGTLFQNNYLQEAFKSVGSADIKQKLTKDISTYEQKIADIKNRQAQLRNSLAGPHTSTKSVHPQKLHSICIEDSPPPPPSMKLPETTPFPSQATTLGNPVTSRSISFSVGSTKNRSYDRQSSAASSLSVGETQKLSFQIRRAVKTDIAGMVRIATPLAQRSRSRSHTPGKRSRRDDRDRRNSRYRSESRERDRYKRRRSRSRSRSRSRRHHSRSRSRSRSRPRHGRSRSRSRSRKRSRSSEKKREQSFGNRVWQRPGYHPTGSSTKGMNERWQHDKFVPTATKPNEDDGPTIEEIDEIINQAQKDRKAEIIKRDKDILKKPSKERF